jgi:hypothetical protein
MKLDDVKSICTEAIQKRLVVEVTYVREDDGVTTCRMMEPFDVAIGRNYTTPETKFWGWCQYHNRIEAKTPANIISISMTDKEFDPIAREKQFSSRPKYTIPRDWGEKKNPC